MADETPKYQSLIKTAHQLGVPEGWLRREAHAGRVPHIIAGRRMLFDRAAVERALDERAAANAEAAGKDGER